MFILCRHGGAAGYHGLWTKFPSWIMTQTDLCIECSEKKLNFPAHKAMSKHLLEI